MIARFARLSYLHAKLAVIYLSTGELVINLKGKAIGTLADNNVAK